MQTSTQDNSASSRSPKIRRDILQTLMLFFVVVVVSVSGGYFAGFQMGKREGARQAVRKVTDFLNPLNALSDNKVFPSTVLGKVSDVSSSAIKVKLANGKEKTVSVTSNTKVTKGDKTLTLDAVKKDSQVTVLTTGKDKDQTATRIVLR